MSTFTYFGDSNALVVAGQVLERGIVVEVSDDERNQHLLEALRQHPDVVEGEVPDDSANKPTALDALVTWLEGHGDGAVDRDELLARLRELDADAIASIAAEYELGVETDVDEASLATVADAILGTEPEPAPEPQPLGERQKVYDRALKDGILEAPRVARSDDGIAAARIEDGKLVLTPVDRGGR